MAILPRYQRLGVQARQPQQVDLAGIREQSRLSQQIAQSFGEMSDFLYRKGAEEAQTRGLERVKEEGARPVLEALQQQGGPRTIAEKTSYEAANRIAVAEIQTEAELEITRILDDGQTKKQSFGTIQARLKDVTDGFPAALSDLDPMSAGLLRARLQDTSAKAEMRYAKWWTGEQQKLRREKQNKVSANEAETIFSNAGQPGYTTAQIDEDIINGRNKLSDLGVSGGLLDSWEKDVRERAYRQNYLFEFYQKPVNEQKETLDRIESGKEKIVGMDYEDSLRFISSMLRPEYNRNVSVQTAQSDFVVNKINDIEDVLDNGGRVSQEEIANLRARADQVKDFDNGAASIAVDQLVTDDAMYAEFRGSTLSQMEATVRQLDIVGIQGQGGAGRDTVAENRRYEKANKFLTNMRKQINDDPMGYAERVDLIQPESIISFEDGRPTIDDTALANRAQQAMVVANHYGLPNPKLLFAEEARQLGLILEKSNAQAKLEILGALSSFDRAAGQVLTDIADYNPNMSLVGALVSEGATEAAQLAVAGMDRIKAGEKPIEFTDTKTVPVYQTTFGRAITTPKHAQAIKGVAKAIYTELAANRGFDMFDEETYAEALQLAAGYRVVNGQEYGGIQEVRGVPTFINPKEQAVGYERVLNEVTPEAIQIATGQTIDPALTAQINENENYKIRNIGGDKYVIEYGEKGDAVVQDTSGAPIIFSSQQLLNAMVPTPPEAMIISPQPGTPAPADQPAQGEFRGAQAVTAPEVPQQAPAFPEVRGISRAEMAKLRTSMEDISMPPGVERLMPFVETVPDGTSNEDYFAYMDAVLGGYRNSYDNWKASQ